MRRLTVHMHKGSPHVLDFDTDEAAATALKEVQSALTGSGPKMLHPVTIAERVVIRPGEVRSADLSDPLQAAGFA